MSEKPKTEIDPAKMYSLDLLKEMMGWGPHSARRARSEGLVVYYYGRHCYVIGSDVIAFITRHGKSERPGVDDARERGKRRINSND